MMLARVADSLYWMGRYAERAEHTCRVADVMLNASLDLSEASAAAARIGLAAMGAPTDIASVDLKWNKGLENAVNDIHLRHTNPCP